MMLCLDCFCGCIKWLTECGKYRRIVQKLSASSLTGPPAGGMKSLNLAKIHEKEVASHKSEIAQLRELAKNEPLVPQTITGIIGINFLLYVHVGGSYDDLA